MLDLLRNSYVVVFVGVFLFFILLHKKDANPERKKEILKILVLVAAWTTAVVYLNIGTRTSSIAAASVPDTSRTFLSQIPRI